MWNVTLISQSKRKLALTDLRDLIECTVMELYSDHFVVRKFPSINCIRVYGMYHWEFAEFSEEEILKNKTVQGFINLVKCRLKLGGFIKETK